ncbi:hypothetical protein JTB14_007092 [Gonioctena quinquepunctata]|nr:hypothetical protein JTB14_007092 [Gonioctena quinquepunctata]
MQKYGLSASLPTPPHFMATPLTNPDMGSDVYQRTPESVASQLPSTVTSAEKIMVIYKILHRIKFGTKHSQYGITKLLGEKVFIDAYPLHEGPYQWTETGNLTDRQLLSQFWANPGCWYKEQPIDLIEKYFGTELGFYFAWIGYSAKMLMPMVILSFLCVFYGLVTITTDQNIKR